MIPVRMELDGSESLFEVSRGERLVDTLRSRAGLVSIKQGCAQGRCGACTVLLNDQPVAACLVLTLQVDGQRVDTLEGLHARGLLRDLQEALIEGGAVACGHCTPGMLLAAHAVLMRFSRPSLKQIREGLEGNNCRCGCKGRIVAAVRKAALRRASQGRLNPPRGVNVVKDGY